MSAVDLQGSLARGHAPLRTGALVHHRVVRAAVLFHIHDLAPVWLVSFVAALLLLVFLVDWLNLVVLYVFGMALAWIVFALGEGQVSDPNVYVELMPVVLFALVVGTVFSYRNEALKQERLDAMLKAGRNLSSELREPLLGIRTSTVSLKRYLPQLLLDHVCLDRAAGHRYFADRAE